MRIHFATVSSREYLHYYYHENCVLPWWGYKVMLKFHAAHSFINAQFSIINLSCGQSRDGRDISSIFIASSLSFFVLVNQNKCLGSFVNWLFQCPCHRECRSSYISPLFIQLSKVVFTNSDCLNQLQSWTIQAWNLSWQQTQLFVKRNGSNKLKPISILGITIFRLILSILFFIRSIEHIRPNELYILCHSNVIQTSLLSHQKILNQFASF